MSTHIHTVDTSSTETESETESAGRVVTRSPHLTVAVDT